MKKLITIVCFIAFGGVCFSQNNTLENFRQNIPMYSSALSLVLKSTKIDPIIPDILERVLPQVANESVDGAIMAISNTLYNDKGIKALDPDYTQFLDTRIHSLIDQIKENNYFGIIATLTDIGITTDNYVKKNFNKNDNKPYTLTQEQMNILNRHINQSHQSQNDQVVHQRLNPNIQQSNSIGDKINNEIRGPSGETVYIGPKGGSYYFNKNGNRVYLRY